VRAGRIAIPKKKLSRELENAEFMPFEQHQLDFRKTLKQVAHCYNLPLNKGNFDVGLDFY